LKPVRAAFPICIFIVTFCAGSALDVIDVIDVGNSEQKRNDCSHQHSAPSPVTADDVRAGAKVAASAAAAVGHVALDVAQAIFHGMQQQQQQQYHHQHQPRQQQPHELPFSSAAYSSVLHPEASSPPPNAPPAAFSAFDVSVPVASEWRTGLFDICSGGGGMVCDAFFCGTCLAYGLQEDLGDNVPLSKCCTAPCTLRSSSGVFM
jgi:hypothetical protein